MQLVLHLKVLLVGAEEEGGAAAGDVRHAGHEQEAGVVGEDVVEEAEPLVTRQHLGEQGLQQGPDVELDHGRTDARMDGWRDGGMEGWTDKIQVSM